VKLYRKCGALCLAVFLALSLAACGRQPAAPAADPAPAEQGGAADSVQSGGQIRVGALKGPTAMGLVKLMEDEEDGDRYDFTLAASADELTPLLIREKLDVACVPANLASVLYNRTEGEMAVLAVNTLGVLYIVENGNAVQSMADLKGMTVVSAGKGATPEYGLRYLLAQNGVDPDGDVNIDWKSEHSECVAALASGAATVAMLPQPFVTVAQGKLGDLRVALDLTAEWDALDNGSAMITGVAVARRTFVEENPQAVEDFLRDYAASVDWVNGNVSEAAELVVSGGILESAAVAEKALPRCNIVCLTGEEMQARLSGYLQVLYDAAPEAVGGQLPGDGFYYRAS